MIACNIHKSQNCDNCHGIVFRIFQHDAWPSARGWTSCCGRTGDSTNSMFIILYMGLRNVFYGTFITITLMSPSCQGRKSSFLDKLWRTSLKLPATPQTSLKRSISREVMMIMLFLFPWSCSCSLVLLFCRYTGPYTDCRRFWVNNDNDPAGSERRRGRCWRGCQKKRQKQVIFPDVPLRL